MMIDSSLPSLNDLEEDDQTKYRSLAKIGHQMEKKFGLHYGGFGAGRGCCESGYLIILFQRHGPVLDVEEAEKLVRSYYLYLIEHLNADLSLRPYLKDFPLGKENIEMTVINYDENGNAVDFPNVWVMSIIDSIIRCRIDRYGCCLKFNDAADRPLNDTI